MKIKISLLSCLFACSLNAFALENSINCPAVDKVNGVWSQVDDAMPNGNHSYVVSSKPVVEFSDRFWSVRVSIQARNQEDAVKLAQRTVKDASMLMTPDAIEVFNQYGCIYFSPRAFVYALTQKGSF